MKNLLCALLLAVTALFAVPAHAETLAADTNVAVLYFENQGNPDLEPLKVGLAQMLITDLTGTPGVAMVERTQLQAILNELELGHSGKVDPDTAAQVGKLLGAEYMVLGTYFEMMGTLRLDARLVRVETGEIVFAKGVNGKAADFMDLEKELATAFETALAETQGAVIEKAPPVEIEPTVPADAEAVVAPDADEMAGALAFSAGLIHADQKDAPQAREAFEKAVAANPELEELAQTQLAMLEI
jgi:TolB-like protein